MTLIAKASDIQLYIKLFFNFMIFQLEYHK